MGTLGHGQFFQEPSVSTQAPETLGVNRVNQDLIDHALYYTGTSADNPGFPGPVPATGVVKLPWEATLFSRGDFSNANVARAQLVLTHVISPAVSLSNRSLFEYVNRRRFQPSMRHRLRQPCPSSVIPDGWGRSAIS